MPRIEDPTKKEKRKLGRQAFEHSARAQYYRKIGAFGLLGGGAVDHNELFTLMNDAFAEIKTIADANQAKSDYDAKIAHLPKGAKIPEYIPPKPGMTINRMISDIMQAATHDAYPAFVVALGAAAMALGAISYAGARNEQNDADALRAHAASL